MQKPLFNIVILLLILLYATESYSQLAVTATKQDVSCNGLLDGFATAHPSGGMPGYSYAWNPSGQTTQTATGLSAGAYTVVVTDAAGVTAITAISIYQPASISISTTYVGPSCIATTGNATANPSDGNNTYSYLWSNGQTTQTVTGLNAGNYTVTVVDGKGCTGTNAVTVTPLTMKASISGDMTICYLFSHPMFTASGGNSYLWNTGETSTSIIVSSSVTTTYSVIASAGTCRDTASATVTVIQHPIVDFSANIGCFGTPTLFTDLSTSSVPLYSWGWNFGDGSPGSNIKNPVHSYSVAGTYTVSLHVYSITGCKALISKSITITPNNPVANFTSTDVCFNTPTQFTDLSTSSSAPLVLWYWSFGDGSYSATPNPTHVYGNPGTYTVSLIVNDSFGCKNTSAQKITVFPTPYANFMSTAACFNTPTLFAGMAMAPSGVITSWEWNFGDPASGVNNNSALQNPAHVFTAAQNFNVILVVTSDKGCQNIVTNLVTVRPLPAVNFTLTKDNTDSLLWYAQPAITGTVPFNYSWNFGDGNTSTQATPSYTYVVAGHYPICLTITDANGCSSSTCDSTYKPGIIKSLVVLNTVTDIEENTISINSVFPNPANDILSISLGRFIQGEIRISDITGREVCREKINANNARINVSDFPVGYYNLTIVSETQAIHTKILIAK